MKRNILVTLLAIALGQSYTAAEIADSSTNGFTYKTTLNIQAPPDAVYQRILAVGNWWSSDHTFSGDAHNMTLEAKPMGCWCEKLPNGGGVRHMEVVNVMPGKLLVLTGGLGPLQSLAVAGTMKLSLSDVNGGTKLDVTYAVSGYLPGGMAAFAAPVDGVLTQQFTRLKNYVEKGDPSPRNRPNPGL